MDLVAEGAVRLGIPLTEQQRTQFQHYFELLVEWNQRINLTAIEDLEGVQTKHFLDSIVGLLLIAEELKTSVPPSIVLNAIDVGSGAGFPGIPLKIVWPSLRLTLLDGTGKKVTFLKEVVQALNLADVDVVQGRAEEFALQTAYREQFDLVMARAVARLNTLVEYLLPFVRQGGFVMAYKGPSASAEFIEAQKAIAKLGGETSRFAPVSVPFLTEERRILLIKKTNRTPQAYPRQRGLPRKDPL
ncbi:16S rRNA (guanine(527)-N(7))-methyltransferase RsmG [bacterium]|nr:16S rRNA (guanine(527)-N(7))-methyltransferase RsmG [bacterium]